MPDLTGVAQRAIRSVTNISSTQVVRTPNSPFANDPFFRYFFGDQRRCVRLPRTPRAEPRLGRRRLAPTATSSPTTTSSTQGVEVSVTMPDKRELRAKVVGVDEATDIAVLKIDATQPAGACRGAIRRS